MSVMNVPSSDYTFMINVFSVKLISIPGTPPPAPADPGGLASLLISVKLHADRSADAGTPTSSADP